MAKKKAKKSPRIVSRRQYSRWQQQKRRQRIISGLGVLIIAAVIVIVLVGWFTSQYQPLHQTVIRVNGTEFNMKYYVDMLKLHNPQGNQSEQYLQYLTNIVAKSIERNELIRQGALRLGYSISDEEVNQKLKDSELPVNDALRDLTRNQMLMTKLRDEYFAGQIPASTEQRHIMAMLLESEPQADEVRERLHNDESFSELAGELSLNALTKAKEGDLGWHPEYILTDSLGTSIPEEYAFGAEVGMLSHPLYDEEIEKEVGYWVAKVLERSGEQAHVLAILLGSEVKAQGVIIRLEAGEEFASLAEEFSQHAESRENGGDLGLVTQGEMSPVIDEFVFNTELEVGKLSPPLRDETVQTRGGYWLVKLVDKDENRQIEKDDRNVLKMKALNDWVSSLLSDIGNEIDESYLDEEKKAWAIERAFKS